MKQLNIIICDDAIIEQIEKYTDLIDKASFNKDDYEQTVLEFVNVSYQDIENIINELLFFTNSFRIELK